MPTVANQNYISKPNDDSYMEQIAQYKDKSYYDYLLNNPFLFSKNNEFAPNFWQQLGESWIFEDYSARNNYYQNLLSQQQQWLSEALERFRQEDYNSAEQQAARERNAGLNPDLAPGSISPGSAAENDQPINPVGMPQDSIINTIPAVGQTILQTAFQVYTGFQNARAVGIDTDIKALSLSKNLESTAWNIISEGVSSTLQEGFDTSDGNIDALFKGGKMIQPVVKYYQDRVRSLPYSSKDKMRLSRLFDSLIYGTTSEGDKEYTDRFERLVADSFKELSNSRSGAVKAYGEIGSNSGNLAVMKFVANEIYRPLNHMMIEIEKLKSQNDKGYQSSALSSGLGSAKAFAEKASYEVKTDILNVKKRLTNAFEQINKKITGSSLSPTWKVSLQAGLSAAEGLVLSNLLKF